MIFADDIVLIDETRDGLNNKLEFWNTLESTGFKLSRYNTDEYLNCRFSGEEGDGEEVTIGEVATPRARKFRYLGSIIEERGDGDEDINHYIRVGW